MSEISVAANSSLNIFTAIRLWKPSLSKTENRIADYFYNHPQEAANQSMLKVAEICHCGEGSIDRFCKKMGYSGFAQVKEMLATQNATSEALVQQVDIEQHDSIESISEQIFNLYTHTIQLTMELNSPSVFQEATNRIVSAKHIFFYGIGDATVPCLCASYRFRRIGFNCYFDFDPDMQLITASNIASDDVVIAISHSGMSRTVNAAVKAAHEAGAFTIGITQSVKSTMTQYCNLIFYNATSDITVGKEIVAHRFSENAIIEILYASVVSKMPETANYHLRKSAEILTANKEPSF